MPKYEILLRAYKTCVVEAEGEREALEVADDLMSPSWDWELDELSIEEELETEEDVLRAIRHGAEDLRDRQ